MPNYTVLSAAHFSDIESAVRPASSRWTGVSTAADGQPIRRGAEELERLGCQPGTAAAEDPDEVAGLVELELLPDGDGMIDLVPSAAGTLPLVLHDNRLLFAAGVPLRHKQAGN